MAEQVPCFQLDFDFLGVENSHEFAESSEEVACNFNKNQEPIRWWASVKTDLHLLKVVIFVCLKYCHRDVLINF